MTEEEKALMLKLVTALRHARPHVIASSLRPSQPLHGDLIQYMDIVLVEAGDLIHWSDNA